MRLFWQIVGIAAVVLVLGLAALHVADPPLAAAFQEGLVAAFLTVAGVGLGIVLFLVAMKKAWQYLFGAKKKT